MARSFPIYVAQSPRSYFEHAETINSIARQTLRIETRDATYIARKISLGLSLQAAELVGKGILRAMEHPAAEIRNQHIHHDVLTLLRDAEGEINASPDQALARFHNFLTWAPEIDGHPFRTTIDTYFQEHFAHGASAKPRNYFYPDMATFSGPRPINALVVIVDYLVQIGFQIDAALDAP